MSWRVAHFMFPFWTQTPNARFSSRAIARAWVPMDDHHSMLFDISGGVDEGNPAYVSKRRNGQPLYEKFEYEPNTNDWHGRWRCRDRAHNDWGLDRQSQRDGTQYTGIGNITIQDQAVTESMGPITDHDWEHLAPTDQMIARTRRRLLLAARAYRDSGELPPGASDPDTFMGARAGSFLFAPTRRWNRLTRRNWKRRCAGRRSPRSGHEGEGSIGPLGGTGHPGLPAGATARGAPGTLHRRCPRRRGAASWPHPQLFPAERPQGARRLRDRRATGPRHPRRLAPHPRGMACRAAGGSLGTAQQLSAGGELSSHCAGRRRHRHHAHAVDDRETATPGIFLGAALRRAHAGPCSFPRPAGGIRAGTCDHRR
jgi:hypothetical protein